MVIEGDARLFITDSIKIESDLTTAEKTQTPCSSIVSDLKAQLIAQVCKVNAVANVEGKGRDDLTITTLHAAEQVIKAHKRNPAEYSKAVLNLANKVKTSFNAFRILMRKYEVNIEAADP